MIAAGSMDMSKSEEGRRAAVPGERTHQAVVRDVPAIVGQNLKRLRKAQGHSLERLAEPRQVLKECFGSVGRLVGQEDNRTGDARLALAR